MVRVEERKCWRTWVLRYNVTRPSDGKRMDTQSDWAVCRTSDRSNGGSKWNVRTSMSMNLTSRVGDFADLCGYLDHEVLIRRKQQTKATHHVNTTNASTKRSSRLARRTRCAFQPLESKLAGLSSRMRTAAESHLGQVCRQMFLVYKHGKGRLIPPNSGSHPLRFVRQSSTSDYERFIRRRTP